MNAPTVTHRVSTFAAAAPRSAAVLREGLVAGLLGGGTIALWFLILDIVQGRPLWTPSILGTALLHGADAIASPQSASVSLTMVLFFTWVHGLVFCILGLIAAWLLYRMEVSPSFGFGIVLLMTVLLCGFMAVCMLFAEPVLHALTWGAVFSGNGLAMVFMAFYFRSRHPGLTFDP